MVKLVYGSKYTRVLKQIWKSGHDCCLTQNLRYRGSDEDLLHLMTKQVVVKQAKSVGGEPKDTRAESESLHKPAKPDSNHYARQIATPDRIQYGEYYGDQWVGRITRLYLEYCPYHDLYQFIYWRGSE